MVKSNGEEENKKPKPGLWERTKQILKPAALIAAATIGFLLGGPIGVALVLGISAFISHKIDQRDARKNANNQDNKGDKNKSDSNDKENKKEGKKPGVFKRLAFAVGAIVLGALIGGPAGIITAVALVVFDFASGGKLTEWSEKVVKVPLKLAKEAWSKGKEIQWTSRGVGEETEKVVPEKEGLGRNGQNGPSTPGEISRSVDGNATDMSTKVKRQAEKAAAPLVQAANSEDGVEVAKENLQQLPPGGQGVDGKTPISPEVQRQAALAAAALAAAPLVQAANSVGGVKAEGTTAQLSSSNGQGVNGSASKQPVPPTQTQGQVAQTANSSADRGENTDNKRVVGSATAKVEDERVAQAASKDLVPR